MMDPEGFLRHLFDVAVAAADPMQVVPAALPPRPAGRVVVIGAGKASARMAEAVESVWGPCEGLVITRYGYGRPCRGVEIVEAGHPVPDQAGVSATGRMLDLLAGLGEGDFVLALISGGGSALLCAPAEGLTLADKQAVNAALLASGAPIDRMNVIRKHLSRVKGGQLAAAAWPARMLALVISDVPGDDLAFIASGPTVGDATTVEAARAVAARYGVAMPEVPSGVIAPGDERLSRCETRIIAAPSQSLAAAAAAAGMPVTVLGDALEGEAADLGAEQARMALAATGPMLFLSGGECTVTMRGATGTGGPNAEFVLSALSVLQGAPGAYVLACDTDGVDGAAEVAGALIGPETWARTRPEEVAAALANHDAHGFFSRIGAQVITGPTLTNVNDFRAVLVL